MACRASDGVSKTDYVYFGYPNWNLELFQQAIKRLHRQGQQKPVICHYLYVPEGMDEVMIAAMHEKGDRQEWLMQALKAKIQKFTKVDNGGGET